MATDIEVQFPLTYAEYLEAMEAAEYDMSIITYCVEETIDATVLDYYRQNTKISYTAHKKIVGIYWDMI